MRTAQQYASKEGMKFRTPSLYPRSPKNQATEFERAALEAFEKDSSLQEVAERVQVDGHEIMRYAQPVRVAQDCLQCHGDPAGEKDPFGFPKEGMKVGELRAAFALEAPTETLVQQARSNMLATFLITFLTVLSAIMVMYFVLRALVVHPVKRCADFAAIIAQKDLTVEDLTISSADEVGHAMQAMNTMKNNLHDVVQSIADTAGHVASASEELSATSQQISANSQETSAQVGVVTQATLACQRKPAERLHRRRGNDVHHSIHRLQRPRSCYGRLRCRTDGPGRHYHGQQTWGVQRRNRGSQ